MTTWEGAFNLASRRLRHDRTFLLRALPFCRWALLNAPEDVRCDVHFMTQAVEAQPYAYMYRTGNELHSTTDASLRLRLLACWCNVTRHRMRDLLGRITRPFALPYDVIESILDVGWPVRRYYIDGGGGKWITRMNCTFV